MSKWLLAKRSRWTHGGCTSTFLLQVFAIFLFLNSSNMKYTLTLCHSSTIICTCELGQSRAHTSSAEACSNMHHLGHTWHGRHVLHKSSWPKHSTCGEICKIYIRHARSIRFIWLVPWNPTSLNREWHCYFSFSFCRSATNHEQKKKKKKAFLTNTSNKQSLIDLPAEEMVKIDIDVEHAQGDADSFCRRWYICISADNTCWCHLYDWKSLSGDFKADSVHYNAEEETGSSPLKSSTLSPFSQWVWSHAKAKRNWQRGVMQQCESQPRSSCLSKCTASCGQWKGLTCMSGPQVESQDGDDEDDDEDRSEH